uniref:Putative evasin n=1 Tax=Ixodes ricinus TaxID=34613 RepID=A0A6B0TTR5_IXORI
MLLLKLTLVILILEIGERTMCSAPGSCATDGDSSPVNLPPSSLINSTDDKKCTYKLLADLTKMASQTRTYMALYT